MVKGKKAKHVKKLTKKQISRRQREQQQLRWIWIWVGTLIALVLIIIAIGAISQNTRAMAVVNSQEIRVAEYQKRVRFWYHYYDSYVSPGALDKRLGFSKTGSGTWAPSAVRSKELSRGRQTKSIM